jgi:integral membrane protein
MLEFLKTKKEERCRVTGYSKRTFEWVAGLEGLSFLALLGVAMPLKYVAGLPLATRIAGLVHGFAFLAYAVVLLDAFATRRWPGRTVALGLLAGVLPAGTFMFVSRVRKDDSNRHDAKAEK